MILEKLKAGIRNKREIKFHGEPLTLRLLSESDILQCRLETLAYAKQKGLDEESQDIENALRQIFAALRDVDGNRVADSIDSFRDLLLRGEREYLVGEYLLLENDCMPSVPGMERAEFEAILAEVKKSPESLLNPSNTATLRRLTTFLESQRWS